MPTHHFLRLSATCLAVALFTLGCGDSDEEPNPQTYCEDEKVNAYARGSVGEIKLNLERDSIEGSTIIAQQVLLKLGDIERKEQGDKVPLLMRIFDAKIKSELLDAMANASLSEPKVLTVVDATKVIAGSEQTRTDLSTYDCSIQNDTICVQIGLDTNNDGQLLNDDAAAFNAASGTVTITRAQNAQISLSWDVELGQNLLTFNDQSSGNFAGCIRARYATSGLGNWQLR